MDPADTYDGCDQDGPSRFRRGITTVTVVQEQ